MECFLINKTNYISPNIPKSSPFGKGSLYKNYENLFWENWKTGRFYWASQCIERLAKYKHPNQELDVVDFFTKMIEFKKANPKLIATECMDLYFGIKEVK